jgi:copper chaperone CopZ
MTDKFLSLGSAVAAFVASLCCLGPLVLGGVGLGAVLMATFAPLRPYFLAVSIALLGLGFYFAYRKPRAAEACDGEVCAPRSRTRRAAKPLLWLATLGVLALALFPYYGGRLIPGPAAAPAATTATLASVELKIKGMSCEACAGLVKHKLLEVPGVAEAEVDYPAGRATVQYDPTKADITKLIAAVNATGYTASLPEAAEE